MFGSPMKAKKLPDSMVWDLVKGMGPQPFRRNKETGLWKLSSLHSIWYCVTTDQMNKLLEEGRLTKVGENAESEIYRPAED